MPSGTYLWDPELAEMVDEAFERAKVDPGTLDVSHLISARRSINLMLAEWATSDMQDYRIDRIEGFALVQGTPTYTVDPDTDGRIIDINQVVITRAGTDTGIFPMSRQELLDIPDKTTQGRPSRYFADKTQNSVTITLWNVPENSTDTLKMDVMRKHQDAGYGSDGPDIPYYMREAFCAGLAARVAEKFGPEHVLGRLEAKAQAAFENANGAQRERGDVVIVPGSNSRRRSGGRAR